MHRSCSYCGAPQHHANPGSFTCPFCQAVNEAAPPFAQPFAPRPMGEPAPSVGDPQRAGAAIAIVIGASTAVLAMAVVGVLAARGASSSSVTVTGPGAPATASVVRRLPVAQLATKPLDWIEDVDIDAPGMIGSLSKFDALANWDWALGVGHAWRADAALYQLKVDPIAADGTVDLTPHDASVTFRMVSLQCRKDEAKRVETEKDFKESSCSLMLTVGRGGPRVKLDLIAPDVGGSSLPIEKPRCTAAQAFTEVSATGKLAKRPTYALRLEHDTFGLLYEFSSGEGSASMPSASLSPSFCEKKTLVR